MDARILEESAFSGSSRDTWLKLVEKALKGADFDTVLTSATDDGLTIEPLYKRRENAQPLARAESGAWTISQRVDDPDEKRALVQMADDLENGATGSALICVDSPASYGVGIEQITPDLLTKMAASRAAQDYAIRLDCGADGVTAAHMLAKAIAAAGNGDGTIDFGIDPVSASAYSGTSLATGKLGDAVETLLPLQQKGSLLTASGRVVHNGGGSEAQELAFMAAALAHYLRELDAAGIAAETAFAVIGLALCADQHQFMTIAKARAARLIHARLQEACGIATPLPAHLMMETSYRMLTRLDPESNLLRNTIAVFAAGVGGADEVTVLPHTLAHGVPDPFARRLARNTQVVLIAESHLDQVTDPAAGSGGMEALTDGLCETAWSLFTEIEAKGGIASALSDGSFVGSVYKTASARKVGPIVGTTLFPADLERPVNVLDPLSLRQVAGLAPVLLADLVEDAA